LSTTEVQPEVFGSLQRFTAEVDFSSRRAAELDLYRRHAFDDPSQHPGVAARLLGHADQI